MSDFNTNAQSNNAEVEYSIPYILKQIAAIQQETAHLDEAIDKLSDMGDGDSGGPGSPGNLQGQAKAKAFADIVRCRETTNQQMLRMYEKILDHLMGAEPHATAAPPMMIDPNTGEVSGHIIV